MLAVLLLLHLANRGRMIRVRARNGTGVSDCLGGRRSESPAVGGCACDWRDASAHEAGGDTRFVSLLRITRHLFLRPNVRIVRGDVEQTEVQQRRNA